VALTRATKIHTHGASAAVVCGYSKFFIFSQEAAMGLLDGLLGAAMGGGQAQNPQGALLNAVLGMLSNGGAQQGGGGLGGMLGGMLGGGGQGGGGLGGMLGGMLGGGQQSAGAADPLSGLLGMLQNSGLGDQAASWVSKGENMPVSAEQIMAALGGGGGGAGSILGQLAQQAGMSHEEAAGGLSQMLPDIIDKLTPHGAVPEGGVGNALEALSGLLKR
jgi:uncharacterized protein YidB (DUF937 family)